MADINVGDLNDNDLRRLRQDVEAETQRRHTMRSVPHEIQVLQLRFLDAEGVEEGEPWRQPTGAHDAYPKDWTVQHNGQTWTSLIGGNVWEPGVSGWRASADNDTGAPALYVQPTGSHDAYNTGDRVTFNGTVYESLIDNNVWAPDAYPAAWQHVTE